MEKISILDYLSEKGIVSFGLSEDRTSVNVEECCDNYFNSRLNRAQMLQLIEELKVIARTMVPPYPGEDLSGKESSL